MENNDQLTEQQGSTTQNVAGEPKPRNPITRRKVLTGAAAVAGAAGAAAFLAACESKESEGPAVMTSKDALEWRMVTTWPPHFPGLGEAADRIAANVERMSGGRFKIKVFGGGELVPPLGVFDAVSGGTVEMGHSAAYYWAGKSPATQFFAAVPFGMNAQQFNAWLYSGGGLELWREVYEPFGLVPMPAGNSGVQMGGWFRKPIDKVDDLKGLKMRIPGLGGKAMAKLGLTVVLLPGSEIFPALERGAIDATEWVGPYNDLKFGLYQAAKYYYYPGWHEPGTMLEFMVSKPKWDGLSEELKAMVEMACGESNMWTLSNFEANNAKDLKVLVDQHGVQLRRFPDSVIRAVKKASMEVIAEEAAKDDTTRKVYDAFKAFKEASDKYQEVSEWAYQRAQTL